jgi:hypothetical protein
MIDKLAAVAVAAGLLLLSITTYAALMAVMAWMVVVRQACFIQLT